jgi:glycosyltransferase involved in cell wall biosynthesis
LPDQRLKILFLHAADSYFWHNRLGLANALREQGFEIVLMAGVEGQHSEFERNGIRVIPWNLSRQSINPFRELRSFFEVVRVYRRERPDVVHHETFKSIIHGGMAARFVSRIPCVNVVSGLGAVFSRMTIKMRFLRFVLLIILGCVFRNPNSRVVFLNDDNRALLLRCKVVRAEQVSVIPGVGVDIQKFMPSPEPDGVPIVLLPARMLWEKGVAEFIAAAKDLRAKNASARFVLVGAPDYHNPGRIAEEQLEEWNRSGVVEWWRQQQDMPQVYLKSTVICLPSYAEGLPNVLTEAGACGRAVITTSAPGCRQAVSDGVNGLLVPVRSSSALSAAIERLLNDPELRARLGAAGRERAVREFSQEIILKQMIEVYRSLLGDRWPQSTCDSSYEPDTTIGP